MPYKIYHDGDEFCVYKHDADGMKMGDSMGCHPTREKAMAQMRALYMNAKEGDEGWDPDVLREVKAAPAPASAAQTGIFIEQIQVLEDTLNREQRTVDVVLIRPGWSKNKRFYPPSVLAKAATVFENILAFADHPSPQEIKEGKTRSMRDITGRYYGVRLGESGELRATRKVYEGPTGDAVWPPILDSIETHIPFVGLSINAIGQAAKGIAPDGQEGMIVENITFANSVDDVVSPAAGGSYETLVAGINDMVHALLEAMTYEEFIAARPDYLTRVRDQMKRTRQDDAVRAALTERDQAQSDLVKAQAENKRLKAQATKHRAELQEARQNTARAELLITLEQALREARLPAEYETDLRERLPALPPADWPAMLDRERRKAQAVGAKPTVPVDGAPRLTEAAPLPPPSASPLPLPHETYADWAQRVGPAGKVRLLP